MFRPLAAIALALQTAGDTFPEKNEYYFFPPNFVRRSVDEKRWGFFPKRLTYIPSRKKRPFVKKKCQLRSDESIKVPWVARIHCMWPLKSGKDTHFQGLSKTLSDSSDLSWYFFYNRSFFLEWYVCKPLGKKSAAFFNDGSSRKLWRKKNIFNFSGKVFPAVWRAR